MLATQQTLHDPFAAPGCMEEPYDMLAELQQRSPVFWSERLRGWVLTRFDDVANAFRDRRFLSCGLESQVRNQLRGHDPAIAKDFVRLRSQMMLHNSGKEHLRLRKPARRPFSSRFVAMFEGRLRAAARELLDELRNKPSFDFVGDFVEPYSTRVIAEIFDVPHGDRIQFQRWSDDVSRFFGESVGNDVVRDAKTANDAILALEDYFVALLEKRRANPGEDLVSLLIEAVDQDRITDTELICQCILIMMAGHFSTIDQLANAMHTLLVHPDQMQDVAGNFDLIPQTVEECMRFDGGVLFMARTLAEELTLGDERLGAGDTVFLAMGAANRDPRVFVEPAAFNLRRDSGRHLGFGFGPHQCIGASLARLEMRVAFEELFRTWRSIAFEPGSRPERKVESVFFRGFYSMKLRGQR